PVSRSGIHYLFGNYLYDLHKQKTHNPELLLILWHWQVHFLPVQPHFLLLLLYYKFLPLSHNEKRPTYFRDRSTQRRAYFPVLQPVQEREYLWSTVIWKTGNGYEDGKILPHPVFLSFLLSPQLKLFLLPVSSEGFFLFLLKLF